jgi:hypothetical protein
MITSLSELISQVESAGKISALRYEPAYHPDTRAYSLAKKYWPGLSLLTYDTVLGSSWGQFQIMGDNLYLLGLDRPILDFWQSHDLQVRFFNLFIQQRNINYTLDDVLHDEGKRRDFAHHYNGNVDAYSAAMLRAYAAGHA